jgi:hypothetical protein
MFLHGWSVRALPLRKAPLGALSRAMLLIVLAVLGAAGSAHGSPGKRADKTGDVDTEHMFGFTEGSDVGAAGEKELETDSTGRFGKLGGSYNNVATALEAKYSFSDSFRLSAVATVAYYDISGVSGLDDRRRGALQSISFDARYRLFDRERAPFGLTLSVEPHWGFADEMSGAPADQQRAAFRVLADRELIADRLFAALNISYEPEQTRLRGSGETLRNSTLGARDASDARRFHRRGSAQPSSLRRARARRFRGAGALYRPDPLRDVRRTIFHLGRVERSGLGRGGRNVWRTRP